LKKDTKISKAFFFLEMPTLHAIGIIRGGGGGGLIFVCNL